MGTSHFNIFAQNLLFPNYNKSLQFHLKDGLIRKNLKAFQKATKIILQWEASAFLN